MEVHGKHQHRELEIGDPRFLPARRALQSARKRAPLARRVQGVLAGTRCSGTRRHERPFSSRTLAMIRYASAPGCDGANDSRDLPACEASANRIDFFTGGPRIGTS
jgi:hypothetical protein